jgi:hypothetical protein
MPWNKMLPYYTIDVGESILISIMSTHTCGLMLKVGMLMVIHEMNMQ